jgi:hypothetical protein
VPETPKRIETAMRLSDLLDRPALEHPDSPCAIVLLQDDRDDLDTLDDSCGTAVLTYRLAKLALRQHESWLQQQLLLLVQPRKTNESGSCVSVYSIN